MAVFRRSRSKKGTRFQAVIRKRRHSLTRTFGRSDDAKAWAAAVENAISNASAARPFNADDWLHEAAAEKDARAMAVLLGDGFPDPHVDWTLGRACRHYREKITPAKKGERQETLRLLAWERHPLAAKRLRDVTTADIQAHVADRVLEGRSASTIAKEVLLLSALYRSAARTWHLDIKNPAKGVERPPLAQGRQRRFEDAHGEERGEEERIREALLAGSCGQDMVDIMDVALETAMRLGEILDIRRGEIRRTRGVQVIERQDSKNGFARRVTLSSRAAEILNRRAEKLTANDSRVFLYRYEQVDGRWSRARKKAGIEGFRFHDLRHEALSRMAAAGLTLGELQAQSGQRTAQILLRYLNAKPSEIARKLG